MTALTAKRATDCRNPGEFYSYDVAASTTIQQGGMVMLNADGYAVPAAALAGNKGVVGVCDEKADNSSGSAGDIKVRVREGIFQFAGTSLLQSHVGHMVYAEDDQTLDANRGDANEPLAGRLVEIDSATVGWVAIGRHFIEESSAGTTTDVIELYDDFIGNAPLAWLTTKDTSAAGSPTLATKADVHGGAFNLAFSATDEEQILTLYAGDKTTIDPTKQPIFDCVLQTNSLNANDILVWGLADAQNDTEDSVASHAWFRIESGLDVLLESDDGSTDNNDKDPSVAITADTDYVWRVDMTDRTDVKFYYRATTDVAWTPMTVAATTFSVGTALLQPFVQLHKSGGTQTTSVQLDWVKLRLTR